MIFGNDNECPVCGGDLLYRDTVKRKVKTKRGKTSTLYLTRFRCAQCHSIHRQIPKRIVPYKHYESDIIEGVKEGLINSDTLGFEDYPCEMTMVRWRSG